MRYVVDPCAASPFPPQAGGRDEFNLDSSKKLGDLQALMIGIKDGTGSDWHLDRVEVTDLKTRMLTTFVCNRWLSHDKTKGDGNIAVMLKAS